MICGTGLPLRLLRNAETQCEKARTFVMKGSSYLTHDLTLSALTVAQGASRTIICFRH